MYWKFIHDVDSVSQNIIVVDIFIVRVKNVWNRIFVPICANVWICFLVLHVLKLPRYFLYLNECEKMTGPTDVDIHRLMYTNLHKHIHRKSTLCQAWLIPQMYCRVPPTIGLQEMVVWGHEWRAY